MIEDAPIVKETRNVRCAISQQFDHDINKYIDYLRMKTHAPAGETGNYARPSRWDEVSVSQTSPGKDGI